MFSFCRITKAAAICSTTLVLLCGVTFADVIQVTTNSATDNRPAWSPQGDWIAFKSERSGNADIWVIPATGGAAIRVTTDPASDTRPTWSEDGTQLAFASDRSGNWDIWVANAPEATPTERQSWGQLKECYR